MARDLFQDGKGAAERLHAAAGAFLGFIVDGRLVRLHQPRNRRLAWRAWLFADLLGTLLVRPGLGARFHSVALRPNAAVLFNPCRLARGNRLRRKAVLHHITIAIDVQYYEK